MNTLLSNHILILLENITEHPLNKFQRESAVRVLKTMPSDSGLELITQRLRTISGLTFFALMAEQVLSR
jgi:hypothetical protein